MAAPTNAKASSGDPGGIGTLGEKTLHAELKRLFEPDTAAHEIRVGPYIADIVGEGGIVEIQTGNFQSLRPKLAAFLEAARVTVVYPIARLKWLLWVEPESGEASSRRKSPRQGNYPDAMFELYKIMPLLRHPNLRLCLLLVDLEEYRLRDGWSKDKKRGSHRYERIPLALAGRLDLRTCADWRSPEAQAAFFPTSLPSPFTSKDYARAARLSVRAAQTALRVLAHMGAAERCGKRGNLYLYQHFRRLP
ncbi:MAG: hypothetical protein LBB75_08580 [Oscillospiraceae bacterium]|jgi:hypothetical protein|nr:hypothetical protein [Oscillospiraceae bacterium]